VSRKELIVAEKVPVAVIIPTYNRGTAVISVLEKVLACNPLPAEIWVHIDESDGLLERQLMGRFPSVCVLTSISRLGPGGGRHRCLLACCEPYAVSLDDDSFPLDQDFFATVDRLFSTNPEAGIFGAQIQHRGEPTNSRTDALRRIPNFIGCGHAIRLAAYRRVRGYLPVPASYEIEEADLSLQLFHVGWAIYESGELRVFHDTDLAHHQSAEVTSAAITNVALNGFLHYPLLAWSLAAIQVLGKVAYCARIGRFSGILSGIWRIPGACWRNRRFRHPVSWKTLVAYLSFRRSDSAFRQNARILKESGATELPV
jgi:glycosyltransferase involved in cell wall biosynthesis